MARLEQERAPQSCNELLKLLPYRGHAIHARWSGDALWSPLAHVWRENLALPAENAIAEPRAGQVLLYAGGTSEPEILMAYGTVRFGCKYGALAGNPVLSIFDRVDELARIGEDVLRLGTVPLLIDINRFD